MRFFNSFLILLIVLGSESTRSSDSNESLFYPDFSQPASVLPEGTLIEPICSNRSDSDCIKKWTAQSIPLSVKQGPQTKFKYFVPSFSPYSKLQSSTTNMKGWTKSSNTTGEQPGSQSFYFNEEDPEKARKVKTNLKGETDTIIEGQVFYVNIEDVTQSDFNEAQSDNKNQDITDSKAPAKSLRPKLRPNVDKKNQEPENTKAQELENTKAQEPENTKAPAKSLRPKLRPKNLSTSKSSSPQYAVKKNTIALPAKGGIEVKPGCFRVNKMEVETQAAFCFECIRNTSENAYFNALLTENSVGSKLKDYLKRIKAKSEGKVRSKIPKTSGDIADTQICSPFKQLKAVIKNFERTCSSPYNQKGKGFKRFFKETLCKSCKKGVPVELMMGMMSIESAGECTARGRVGQDSAGLFQVDSNQHICKKGYKKGTEKNAQCLAKIHNNWDKAIEILSTFYKNTNGKKLKKPCENWLDMESKDRDSFRRAVAGYNGGYWFLNAIRAAKNNTDEKDKSKYGLSYKHDKSNWEEVRAFYFMQHIQRNSQYKRRALEKTLSNLAHTEAVLGREVKNSVPGIIEIWSQYKREFLKQNPTQCH